MTEHVSRSPLLSWSLALDRASTRRTRIATWLRRRARVLGIVARRAARVAGVLVSVNRARN